MHEFFQRSAVEVVHAQRAAVAGGLQLAQDRRPVDHAILETRPLRPPDQAIRQAGIARDLATQGFILFNLSTTLAEETLPAFGLGFTAPMPQALEIR